MTSQSWIPHPTRLDGERVQLLPLERRHLEDLYSVGSDKALWKHIPTDCSDKDRFYKVYTTALVERANKKQYPFVICHKPTLMLIGSTRLFEIDPTNRKIEIGWTWISPQCWGTGINTECKYLLLKFCFEVLKTVRVQLKTDEQNLRSRKAIEKIGGRFEGIWRKDKIKDNGQPRNAAYYSILDDEWEEVKERLERLLNSYNV